MLGYLDAAGGWEPDDVGDPTGLGQPHDGSSYLHAATVINNQKFGLLNTATVQVPVTLTLSQVGNFATGTPSGNVLAGLQLAFQHQISRALSDAQVRITSFDWAGSSGSVRAGGSLSSDQRVAMQDDIVTLPVLVDPAEIATVRARSVFNLDDSWMCHEIFDAGETIVCYIRKYTNIAYSVEDDVGYEYLVGLDAVTLKLQSCIRHTP